MLKIMIFFHFLKQKFLLWRFYNQFYIKSILGNLSISDINREYKVNYDMKENALNFNILDHKTFN
jgi:hypothetical protein